MDVDILKIRRQAYLSLTAIIFFSAAIVLAYGIYDIHWKDSALYVYAVIIALAGGNYLAITLTAQYYWDGDWLDIIKPSGILVVAAMAVPLLTDNTVVSAIVFVGTLVVMAAETTCLHQKYRPDYERKLHQKLSAECREYYKYDQLPPEKQQKLDKVLQACAIQQLVNMLALLEHIRNTYGEDEDLYEFLPENYK